MNAHHEQITDIVRKVNPHDLKLTDEQVKTIAQAAVAFYEKSVESKDERAYQTAVLIREMKLTLA
jgi:hypothetical protein